MRCLKILFISSLIVFASCESDPAEIDCKLIEDSIVIPGTSKILFIGNSHTYVNEIPETISQMALLSGDSTFVRQVAPGGMTLEEHSTSAQTLQAISAEQWDVVVLQGSGWKNALSTTNAETSIYPFVQVLVDSIRSNSTQIRIVCYMTHGYESGVLSFGDELWCEEDPVVCDYEGMQARIRDNYVQMVQRFALELAPAGILWKIYMDEHPGLELHGADGIHASPEGSYLTACTLYSLIFARSPVDKYLPSQISKEVSSTMQETVYDVLFQCKPDWRQY